MKMRKITAMNARNSDGETGGAVLDLDPTKRLFIAIIRQAKTDAEAGNVAALAWLVYAGADYAEAIAPGTGECVLNFARRCWAALAADTQAALAAQWGTGEGGEC